MNKLANSIEINKLIQENSMAIVYFTGNSCGACEADRKSVV